MEQVYTPPCSVDWFQAELDNLADCPPFRIRWAPQLTIARVVSNDGTERNYAKYPLLYGYFADYTRGTRYVRKVKGLWVQTGYQRADERVIPDGVLVTDIALPEIVHVNPSVHMFVIERKLPDESARKIHDEKRDMAIVQLGLDIFGPFPAEGHWDWFMDIAEHRFEEANGTRVLCCESARKHNAAFCRGLYRPPTEADLIEVKQSVAYWLANIAGHEKDTQRQEWMARGLITETFAKDRHRLIDMLHRAGEADNKRAQYEHSARVPRITNKQRGKHAKSSDATR